MARVDQSRLNSPAPAMRSSSPAETIGSALTDRLRIPIGVIDSYEIDHSVGVRIASCQAVLYDDGGLLIADQNVAGFMAGLVITGIGYRRNGLKMWHHFEGGTPPRIEKRSDGRWLFAGGSYSLGPEGIRD